MTDQFLRTAQIQDSANTNLVTILDSIYNKANSSGNSAAVYANSASGLAGKSLNFNNTASVLVAIADKGDGNANISFTAISSNVTIQIACSDLTTNLAVSPSLAYVRSPKAFTLTTVRASLGNAATTGGNANSCRIYVQVNGSNALSTPLTFTQGQTTTVGANIAYVIGSSSVPDDALINIQLANVGAGANGLIVTLLGN